MSRMLFCSPSIGKNLSSRYSKKERQNNTHRIESSKYTPKYTFLVFLLFVRNEYERIQEIVCDDFRSSPPGIQFIHPDEIFKS